MELNFSIAKRFISSLAFGSLVLLSCSEKGHHELSWEEYHQLSDEEKRSTQYALEGIDLFDQELELTLFASEPMMSNPTNMDIDDKGRVWICEAVNYRMNRNPKNEYKEEGDRILILEDLDNDGVADTSKVFYQGTDINSALGVAVFGNKVIVSCSPNVYVFTDEDGDDIPDSKELLFTGVGGVQHDHGMHSFTFGMDGKLYFTYGNEGNGLHTANGEPLKDKQGNLISGEGNPYREGMVFRCDPDGSNVEILGWNFRNNYELAVDSYGRMWQSDNDDDGNRGTRINYVMDYGNYGYKDEITGSDWRTRRVNMEDSVFHQHWHLNDPGVIPNLIQTYAGSPTGIIVYEGKLLPTKYQNQIIHCDAGPNVVRMYPVEKQGAGFSGEIQKIMEGIARDNWFRPSDITVAPDGSIFIADWYDPGVGGHAAGDINRGRVYRLAPKGVNYNAPKHDYTTVEGAIEALKNANIATRFNAFQALQKFNIEAEAELLKLYQGNDQRLAARAFWLLSKLPNGKDYIFQTLEHNNENLRVAAVRAMRLTHVPESFWAKAAKDDSPQVRREVAFGIRHKDMPAIWNQLAQKYDGKDRWYLEALGIAAEGNWDEYLSTYLNQKSNWYNDQAARNIVWRSRAEDTHVHLAKIIQDTDEEKWKYYRALDFQPNEYKVAFLQQRLTEDIPMEEKIVALRQISPKAIANNPELGKVLENTIAEIDREDDFIEIVEKFKIATEKDKLIDILQNSSTIVHIAKSAKLIMELYGMDTLKEIVNLSSVSEKNKMIERIGYVDEEPVTNYLISIWQDDSQAEELRNTAMQAMNGSNSERVLWDLIEQNEVPELVLPIAKDLLLRTWNMDIQRKAVARFANDVAAFENMNALLSQSGDAQLGSEVFSTYCSSCHMVNGEGIDFGPGLSKIGAKLSKQGLYNSIINPSEGVGFGYETQKIVLKNGEEYLCIVTAETENEVYVKYVGQSEPTAIRLSEIESIEEQEASLMPKLPLEEKELVNLVSYLEGLK